MYMDEAAILNGPFLFVSYSHRDAEIVHEDVEKLIAQGVRIWVDHRSDEIENMHLSDNWFQKVEAAVCHPNCRGVVFYISRYALLSKSIQREQKLVRKTENLPYYCVSVDGVPVSEHFREAFKLVVQPDSPFYDPQYYDNIETVAMQKEMFHDDKLAIFRDESDACVQQIYSKIALPLGTADDESVVIATLEKNRLASKDTGNIVLGIYKGSKCEPVSRSVENSRFVFMDKQYIHHNGEFFTGRPLNWKLLYIKDYCAVLICSEVLEKGPFTEIPAFLKVFTDLAFSSAEKAIVSKVRLMNAQDEKEIDSDRRDQVLALDASLNNMYWWIDEEGIMPQWRLTYRDNQPVPNGFLVTRPKGFRPVIEVQVDDLKDIKGG